MSFSYQKYVREREIVEDGGVTRAPDRRDVRGNSSRGAGPSSHARPPPSRPPQSSKPRPPAKPARSRPSRSLSPRRPRSVSLSPERPDSSKPSSSTKGNDRIVVVNLPPDPPPSKASATILVRGLPPDVSTINLILQVFADDDVKNAVVHTDEEGESLGTAELVFNSTKEAVAALRHHGTTLHGHTLKMCLVENKQVARSPSPDAHQENNHHNRENRELEVVRREPRVQPANKRARDQRDSRPQITVASSRGPAISQNRVDRPLYAANVIGRKTTPGRPRPVVMKLKGSGHVLELPAKQKHVILKRPRTT